MSQLYIVGTPLGNLGDLTFRAKEVLASVAVIACEDTRVTGKLLQHYQITTPTVSLHQHTTDQKINQILDRVEHGQDVAVVTDAGMPSVSDPGGQIVAKAYAQGIKVEIVPGPSAVTAALALSGVPADSYWFVGFPPHKKGRQTLFQRIAENDGTVVMYESPHRLVKTLASLAELMPLRLVVVCRELTKIHESVVRGTAAEVVKHYQDHPDEVRGEIVIIVGPE